ncbi:RHS repeat-associated core domain-containing protein [Thalassospira sp. NFXS8]|uniref:RHS repeat domain-containing protein n=1 Tax=Thalassospira sp. NFXS8 TaxID=2819093 RepID=UPI0032DE2C4D
MSEAMSYDAHGARREASWEAVLLPVRPVDTPRGFTGHEHLDAVGIIHMNGRIYDPELGRMLSPDPNVPDPTVTQSFNRYAYVHDNPLSYTDPTGFSLSQNGRRGELGGGTREANDYGSWGGGNDRGDGTPAKSTTINGNVKNKEAVPVPSKNASLGAGIKGDYVSGMATNDMFMGRGVNRRLEGPGGGGGSIGGAAVALGGAGFISAVIDNIKDFLILMKRQSQVLVLKLMKINKVSTLRAIKTMDLVAVR